jgi:hypothetical protein
MECITSLAYSIRTTPQNFKGNVAPIRTSQVERENNLPIRQKAGLRLWIDRLFPASLLGGSLKTAGPQELGF